MTPISILFKQYGFGATIDGRRLKLFGIGRVRVRWHRPREGQIKTVRILHRAGQWFVLFACDVRTSTQAEIAWCALKSIYGAARGWRQGDYQVDMTGSVILSAIVLVILLGTGWLGGELSYRYRVGVMARKP